MIKVCGCNNYGQLGEKSNNHSPGGFPAISPLHRMSLAPTTLSSISFYCDHTVIITGDTKSAKSIGYNEDCRASCSIPRQVFSEFIDIPLQDCKGHKCIPISAVCGEFYTLYMVLIPEVDAKHHLLFSFDGLNGHFPLFLNIGDSNPVGLFGGRLNSAAIESNVGILYVSELQYDSPNLAIKVTFLPGGDKTVSVAVCDDFIVALGKSGRVFLSSSSQTDNLNFSEVKELNGIVAVNISGTFNHCLVVSNDGRVFGRGSNKCGKLGIGKEIEEVNEFVQIEALKSVKICQAFAGKFHSLFLTDDGKVLACGSNDFGHLFCNDGITEYSVFSPIETEIKENAKFCVAGDSLSAVFVNCDPPKNCPNRNIEY